MSKLEINTVISSLPSMGRTELRNMQQAISLLLAEQPATDARHQADSFEMLLYQAVAEELKSRGIRQHIPFEAFTQTRQYKAWKRGLQHVKDFISSQFKNHAKDERAKRGLLRLLISALCDELKERNISVGLSTIASNISRLPEVFDNAFPGYLSSGLAFIVPLAMKRRGLAA